jgi:thioredoxin-like negative regulator of GroEL
MVARGRARLGKGRDDEALRQLTEARSSYERVLALSPRRLGALSGLGDTYLLDDQIADVGPGIAALEQAVDTAPYQPRLRLELARLLIRNDELEPAAAHLGWILDAYPETGFAAEAEVLLPETNSK